MSKATEVAFGDDSEADIEKAVFQLGKRLCISAFEEA
jgi:hypothetical protein